MRKHTVILISLLFMLLFSCTHAGAIDLAQGQYLKISEDTVTEGLCEAFSVNNCQV